MKINRTVPYIPVWFMIMLIFCFLIFSLPVTGDARDKIEPVIYLDFITAHEFNLKSANNLKPELHGINSEKGRCYKSDQENLKAYLIIDSNKSDVLIEWRKASLRIPVKGEIADIRWRPKNTGFIYPLFDVGSGGDFGTTSFHYVSLSYVDGKINMKDTEISAHQMNTDLGWSSDGKYYAYSEASSLRIKNFETGKVWATKLITVDTKAGKVGIPEGIPNQLSGFIWLDGDKKLLFIWKNHPFDDAPVGAAIVNIDQFKLDD